MTTSLKTNWKLKGGGFLPALQQLRVDRLLPGQVSLGLARRLAVERDPLLHRWVAEGVSAAAELSAGFRVVVVGEGRRGAWRRVARRLLILLKGAVTTRLLHRGSKGF